MDKEDKKLLELAAKAVGIDLKWKLGFGLSEMSYYDVGGLDQPWNPLKDDGDAFRLMVDCGLTVCTDGEGTVSASEAWNPGGVFVTQSINGDKREATRRAIVRAAAIGVSYE